MKKLALSLALAVFLFAVVGLAGGAGVASGHAGHAGGGAVAGEYVGAGEDGINKAATQGGAFAPVGTHVGSGPGDGNSDVPGNPGFVNGVKDASGVPNNPLCPLNDAYPDPVPDPDPVE